MAQSLAEPGHNLTPDVFVSLWIELRQHKRKVDEANGTYRAHRKRMEKMGVNLKSLALTEKFADKDPDELAAEIRQARQYSEFLSLPFGTQREMFADAPADAPGEVMSLQLKKAEADEAGYQSGIDGGNRDDNPNHAGTELAAAWDTGYLRGQERIVHDMAAGKPPRGKRSRTPPPARGASRTRSSRLGA